MKRVLLLLSLFLLALIVPPALGNLYWLDTFVFMLIFVILTTSLRLVFSTGQISFAHPGIAAISGYCSGALTLNLGVSFWITLPVACIVAACVSFLLGYLTLRLKGVYFFLITFMFTSLIGVLIGNFWTSSLGGWRGLLNIPRPQSIPLPFLSGVNFATSELAYYYLTLFFAVINVTVCYNIERSRFGLVFNAIEEADSLAEMLGISLIKYKLVAFVTAGIFAGLAGVLFAHYQRIITPYDFDMHYGILLIIYIVVGGMDTLFGPLLGTIAFRLLAEPLRQFGEYETMILGLILILFLLFLPGGLVSLSGYLDKIVHKIRKSLHRIDYLES